MKKHPKTTISCQNISVENNYCCTFFSNFTALCSITSVSSFDFCSLSSVAVISFDLPHFHRLTLVSRFKKNILRNPLQRFNSRFPGSQFPIASIQQRPLWTLEDDDPPLFRNKRFALNEMFQRNASKFAIFYA